LAQNLADPSSRWREPSCPLTIDIIKDTPGYIIGMIKISKKKLFNFSNVLVRDLSSFQL